MTRAGNRVERLRAAWRLVLVGGSVVALTVAVAACGGSDNESNGSASASDCKETETLSVGTQPIAPVAPLYLGVQEGIFERNGLDIEIHGNEKGATAAVAAVMSGTDDIAFSDWVGVLLGANKGLPLRVIVPVAGVGPDRSKTYLATMVPGDSDIERPEDLEGKTIGVNGVGNVEDITIKAALQKHGVDPDSLEFLIVPFAETQAALEQGRIDAAFFVEPFLSQGLAAGDRIVLYMGQEVIPRGALSVFFTSEETANERACAIDRFEKAWKQAEAYALANPDQVRTILTTYTEIPPEAAAKIRLPIFGADLTYQAGMDLGSAMVDLGLLPETPDYDTIILNPR